MGGEAVKISVLTCTPDGSQRLEEREVDPNWLPDREEKEV